MAKFCSECGSSLAANARFCSECGTVVGSAEAAAPVGPSTNPPVSPTSVASGDEAAVRPVQPINPAPHPELLGGPQYDDEQDGEPQTGSRRGLILAGVAVVALAVAGGAWMGLSVIGGSESDTPVTEQTAPVEKVADTQELYAMAKANVRDKPSLSGSKIIGSLERGEKASGTTVTEADGRIWLKLDGAERYVSLANLSKIQPPVLTSLDGSDRIVSGSCTLLEAADGSTAVKASLKQGAAVKNFGITVGGYTEYGLPGGGVGYASSASPCATSPSTAKGAVANQLIKFDPNTCEFGAELASYFDKAHAVRESKPEEYELEELTVPVDKLFHGLRVTVAISGYEWTGVAFADSVPKVREVFRKLGYSMDKNGEFIINEDTPVSTSLVPTDRDMAAQGKSRLTCGV